MSRTDRLYALVEELRAVSPRPRSARWLANRFECSARTIERDLGALQESGVPIYAEPGSSGGYVLAKEQTLPPLTITASEAAALAAALPGLAGTPFAEAARTALRKVLTVMPARERAAAEETAARIQLVVPVKGSREVPQAIQRALASRRVLRLGYVDRRGVVTERLVEPLGFLGGELWYLIGWCRLRDAVRGFRLDRVREVETLDETIPTRAIDIADLDALGHQLVGLNVFGNTGTTVSRKR